MIGIDGGDRQGGRRRHVVIKDGAAGGAGGDGGAAGAAQGDGEAFIVLHAGVTADIHGDRVAALARSEEDAAGGEYSTSKIGSIGGIGAGTADSPGGERDTTGVARAANSEGESHGAGIAF